MRGRRRGRADALRSDRRPDHGSPTPRDASERVHGFSTTVPARDRRVVGGSAAARLDWGGFFPPGARVDEPRFTLSDVARRVATPTTMITTGLLSESRRGRAGGFAPGCPCRSIVAGLPSRLEKAETSLAPAVGGALPAAVSGAVRCARAVAPVTRCVAGSRPSVWVARVVPSGEVRPLVGPCRIDRQRGLFSAVGHAPTTALWH